MINIGGLDFGNSKCVVSILKDKDIHIELNSHSNRQTPTIITITSTGRYSGELSLKKQVQFPYSTIVHLRDLIRFSYEEFIREQNRDPTSLIKHSVIGLPKEALGIKAMYIDKEIIFRGEQCVSFLLGKLSSNKIDGFVAAVNAFSSDHERRSLLNSFKISRLQCPRILNTTTAAAIAYSFQFSDFLPPMNQEAAKVLFLDVGESETTFTVSNIQKQSVEIINTFQIKGVSGSLITQAFEKYLIDKLINRFSINPTRNPEDLVLFKQAVNKAKMDLSKNKECIFVFQPSISKIVCKIRLSISDFEMILQDIIYKLGRQIEPLANRFRKNLYDIQLLGGAFQFEIFKKVVIGQIYKSPAYQINSDEFISLGCGYMASHLNPNSNISLHVQDIFNRNCVLMNQKNENLLILEKTIILPYVKNVEVNVTKSLILSMYNILEKESNEETPNQDEKINISENPFSEITISTGIDEETTVTFTLTITENGIFEFSNGFYIRDDQRFEAKIEADFVGDMTEDEINELAKMEEEMLISDAKMELKLQFENFKEEFYNFFDPSIVDEVKSQISLIHSWYKENENNRLQPSDYSEKTKEFQILTSPAFEQKKKYEKNCQNIKMFEDKVLDLLYVCKEIDDPKVDQITELLNTFKQKILISKETPKYKNVDFTFEKGNRLLNMIESIHA